MKLVYLNYLSLASMLSRGDEMSNAHLYSSAALNGGCFAFSLLHYVRICGPLPVDFTKVEWGDKNTLSELIGYCNSFKRDPEPLVLRLRDAVLKALETKQAMARINITRIDAPALVEFLRYQGVLPDALYMRWKEIPPASLSDTYLNAECRDFGAEIGFVG